MKALSRELRSQLEKTVIAARDVAEQGARAALERLAVEQKEPFAHMTPEQRDLRLRLRARARALGDTRDEKSGRQEIAHLVHECAYEHWHQMLFARFLAENHLLIHPESGVAVSLEECEELAADEGAPNGWALARRYAARMLPEIFRPDDPVLQVTLAPEHQQALERLLAGLPSAVFAADDSLGWVYQFWQTKRKEEVNRSGNKIGADELPSVTQLFTEDYMVDFLLDNTLGAWHAGRVLAANPRLAESAKSEEELRKAVALPGVDWKYLRFVREESSKSGATVPVAQRLPKESGATVPVVASEKSKPEACSTFADVLQQTVYFNPYEPIENTERNLPHWRQPGATYFVTFRLPDALPAEKLAQLRAEREAWLKAHPQPHSEADQRDYFRLFSQRVQDWLDAGTGSCLLRDERAAQIVATSLWHFDGRRYDLGSWVVMPNHVHAVVTPCEGWTLDQILHSWKSFTAHEINKLLGRQGPVWQHEGHDHIVRNPQALWRIEQYIAENPQKAGVRTKFVHSCLPKESGESGATVPVAVSENNKPEACTTFADERGATVPVAVSESDKPEACSTSPWRPAAGTFEGWPKTAKELKCLDPCMGSGHFVVAMFERLVALRMAEEKLDEAAAVAAVIRDNLFGLEIDPRCTQIGAFNLALAAWRRVGHRPLPAMNLACSGLAPNAKLEDWLNLAEEDSATVSVDKQARGLLHTQLHAGMERLYRLFEKAPVLGSLINPRASEGDLLVAAFHELQPLLEKALAQERSGATVPVADESKSNRDDCSTLEMAVTARGLAKAAEILAGQFTLVATNVPYLGRGKQDDVLKEFCERHHPDAKADLATCFVERCLAFCAKDGTTALVTPQNWLFLTSYKRLRVESLESARWGFVVRLGEHGFDSPQAAGAFTALLILNRQTPDENHNFAGIEAADEGAPSEKDAALLTKPVAYFDQAAQLKNPNSKVVLQTLAAFPALELVALVSEGLHTGDYPRFGRNFWELSEVGKGWEFQQGGITTDCFHSGMEHILFWENGSGVLIDFVKERLDVEIVTQWIKGDQVWGRTGIAVGTMRDMKPALYQGALFTHGVVVVVPQKVGYEPAVRAFCESPAFCEEVRKLDQKVCVARDSIAKVPFDLARWQKVAAEKYPNGLPKPFSSDPTQWLFNGHPVQSGATVPVASPEQSKRDACATLHVAVARLLGYQWPRQTGSSFADCPALGPDGLEAFTDTDGIVCVPSVRGEEPAAERLRKLLAAAYGREWSPAREAELLESVGFGGKALEQWLRDGFFEQHCQLFHQRPFVWHIWDGQRGGFSALVNYHKLDYKNLESLTYTYLGDWISRVKDEVRRGEGGAEARLVAAEELQKKLRLILEGEPPYDIFVRWKPIEQQPIGWNPDLNDGVRLNIRPFVTAGVLRKNPNIHWRKDRGKDVVSAPWYHLFKGDRINDHHLTLEEKRRARNLTG